MGFPCPGSITQRLPCRSKSTCRCRAPRHVSQLRFQSNGLHCRGSNTGRFGRGSDFNQPLLQAAENSPFWTGRVDAHVHGVLDPAAAHFAFWRGYRPPICALAATEIPPCRYSGTPLASVPPVATQRRSFQASNLHVALDRGTVGRIGAVKCRLRSPFLQASTSPECALATQHPPVHGRGAVGLQVKTLPALARSTSAVPGRWWFPRHAEWRRRPEAHPVRRQPRPFFREALP